MSSCGVHVHIVCDVVLRWLICAAQWGGVCTAGVVVCVCVCVREREREREGDMGEMGDGSV